MEEKRIFQRQKKKKKTYFYWKKENIPKVIKKHIFDLNLIIISIEILLKEKKKLIWNISIQKKWSTNINIQKKGTTLNYNYK